MFLRTGHQHRACATIVLAGRQGFAAIYLYTHEKMTENQALYSKIGYLEYDRRVEKGYPRVYMRKQLA